MREQLPALRQSEPAALYFAQFARDCAMDTSLKQRLVGAAVLVALAVIFLPMLVQGPAPGNGAGDVSLDLPAQPPSAMETRELPLQLPPAQTPAPALLPDDPNRVVTVDADSAAQTDALTGHEPADATGSAAPSVALTAPPLPVPSATTTKPAADSPPATTDIAPPAVVATPPVPAPKPPTALPLAAGSGGYAVNLGAYGNLANANALLAQLRSAGLPATSDAVSIGGKPGARLRLGPYDRRADAEADRLKALRVRADLPASVVALDGAAGADATATSKATAGKVGFAVQVGAFRDMSDATALVETLRKAGFVAFSESVKTDGGTLYRVRVGPEIRRADADKLRATLASKLKLDGIVVPHP